MIYGNPLKAQVYINELLRAFGSYYGVLKGGRFQGQGYLKQLGEPRGALRGLGEDKGVLRSLKLPPLLRPPPP